MKILSLYFNDSSSYVSFRFFFYSFFSSSSFFFFLNFLWISIIWCGRRHYNEEEALEAERFLAREAAGRAGFGVRR
jgi:hypothetical protein